MVKCGVVRSRVAKPTLARHYRRWTVWLAMFANLGLANLGQAQDNAVVVPPTQAASSPDHSLAIPQPTRERLQIEDYFQQSLEASGVTIVAPKEVDSGYLVQTALLLATWMRDEAKTNTSPHPTPKLIKLVPKAESQNRLAQQSTKDADKNQALPCISLIVPASTAETSFQERFHLAWNSSIQAQPVSLTDEAEDALDSLTEGVLENGLELAKAWRACNTDRQSGLLYLLTHMTAADRRSLRSDFLLEHVDGAYDAWQSAKWSKTIPTDVFMDWILPYVNVNESRDAWRADFQQRFAPLVADAKTPAEAATLLNQKIFGLLDVRYSTQRRRADQGPYESIETHMASCTGLSILLIDACRSVGVPARFVGTPRWSDNSGNHSWVEIWSDGEWHFTGACEPAGDRLNEGWFIGRAAEAKNDDPRYAIYAASFRRTPLHFPLVWNMGDHSVYGINITHRYLQKDRDLEAGKVRVRFCVRSLSSRQRCIAPLTVKDAMGTTVLEGKTRDDGFDSNDHLEAVVELGKQYQVFIEGLEPRSIDVTTANELFVFEK